MSSQKKCPSCGQWTSWNQRLEDKCEHCGVQLEKQRAAEAKHRKELAGKPLTFTKRKIEPGDSLGRTLYKRIFNATGAAYFAFLSFLVWLIAVVVH